MPGVFKILPDIRVVHVRYWGHVTLRDRLELCQKYLASGEADDTFSFLMDHSETQSIESKFTQVVTHVRRLSPHIQSRQPSSKTAFFVPTDLSFGAGRMYQSIAAQTIDHDIALCRTPQEAVASLGRKPEHVAKALGQDFFAPSKGQSAAMGNQSSKIQDVS